MSKGWISIRSLSVEWVGYLPEMMTSLRPTMTVSREAWHRGRAPSIEGILGGGGGDEYPPLSIEVTIY